MTFEVGDIVQPIEGVELCSDTLEFFRGVKEGEVLEIENNLVVLDATGRNVGWHVGGGDKMGWNVFICEIELVSGGNHNMINEILKEAWEGRGNLAVLTVYKERTGRDI